MELMIDSSRGLTKQEIYLLMTDPEAQKLRNYSGAYLNVRGYVLYRSEVRQKKAELEKLEAEEYRTILALKTGEEIVVTNSATFIEQFLAAWNFWMLDEQEDPQPVGILVKVVEKQGTSGMFLTAKFERQIYD